MIHVTVVSLLMRMEVSLFELLYQLGLDVGHEESWFRLGGCGVLIYPLMGSFANWACRLNSSAAGDAAKVGGVEAVVVMMVRGGVSVLWLVG